MSPFDQTSNTHDIALPWTEIIKMQHVTYLGTVYQVIHGTRDNVAGPIVPTVQALLDELPQVFLHIILRAIRPEAMGHSLHALMPGVLHVSIHHQPRL